MSALLSPIFAAGHKKEWESTFSLFFFFPLSIPLSRVKAGHLRLTKLASRKKEYRWQLPFFFPPFSGSSEEGIAQDVGLPFLLPPFRVAPSRLLADRFLAEKREWKKLDSTLTLPFSLSSPLDCSITFCRNSVATLFFSHCPIIRFSLSRG